MLTRKEHMHPPTNNYYGYCEACWHWSVTKILMFFSCLFLQKEIPSSLLISWSSWSQHALWLPWLSAWPWCVPAFILAITIAALQSGCLHTSHVHCFLAWDWPSCTQWLHLKVFPNGHPCTIWYSVRLLVSSMTMSDLSSACSLRLVPKLQSSTPFLYLHSYRCLQSALVLQLACHGVPVLLACISILLTTCSVT